MFFGKKKKWLLMAATDVGNIREINEDNVFVMEEISTCEQLEHFSFQKKIENSVLCAVCDGMGGGTKGEVASHMAVQYLQEINMEQLRRLEDSRLEDELKCYVQTINNSIFEQLNGEGGFSGCTMTLLYADEKRTFILNIGDSPCILVDKEGHRVLSVSDNRANQLYQMGKISEEERWTHKTKNQLTQYLGMNPQEISLSPHTYWGKMMEDEQYYILASDGLLDNMGFEKLEGIYKLKKSENIARTLVDMALQCGSRDNVSVIVVKRER